MISFSVGIELVRLSVGKFDQTFSGSGQDCSNFLLDWICLVKHRNV